MANGVHTVRADWRDADAIAFEERVHALADWLDHTEDLIIMFSSEEAAAKELRAVVGLIKMRRNDFAQKAAELRAELADRDRSPD